MTRTVKGSEIPYAWGFDVNPERQYRIVLEIEDTEDDLSMPPEEAFRPEFIEAVKEADEALKRGEYTDFESVEEWTKDIEHIYKKISLKHRKSLDKLARC